MPTKGPYQTRPPFGSYRLWAYLQLIPLVPHRLRGPLRPRAITDHGSLCVTTNRPPPPGPYRLLTPPGLYRPRIPSGPYQPRAPPGPHQLRAPQSLRPLRGLYRLRAPSDHEPLRAPNDHWPLQASTHRGPINTTGPSRPLLIEGSSRPLPTFQCHSFIKLFSFFPNFRELKSYIQL